MRISDWSSDVCSSDLPTAADCPSGTTDVGEIAGLVNCQLPSRIIGDFTLPKVDGVVFSLNGRTDVGEDMGGDAANPNPPARKGTLTVEPGVTVFGSAGADFLMVNRGSQIFAEGTATERSEEHTSELQSLMRTSYAVFCLKKHTNH